MEVYAAVRAHGIKSRLLSKQDYEALVSGAKQLWDFPDYAHVSARDPLEKKLEKVYEVYVRRMSLLARIPEVSSLVYALLDRLEVENIKFHLRHVTGYQRPVLYYPYGRILGLEKLLSLKTESAIWEELSRTPLKAPAAPSFKTRLIAEREVLLEILYYNYLAGTISSLKTGREVVETLTKLVIYHLTVSYALWRNFLPEDIIRSLLEMHALRLKPSGELLIELRGSTTEILQKGVKMLVERARTEALNHPLDLAYIYALNYLLLLEAQNLEKVLIGKELGVAEEVLLKNLIFPQLS